MTKHFAHIASTLPNSQRYVIYHKKTTPGGVNLAQKSVLIKGGAGVANKKHALAAGTLTAPAVLTSVTEEELELLMADSEFQNHMKRGYLKVIKSNAAPAPEKAAKDLEKSDASAPLTPDDYSKGGRATTMGTTSQDLAPPTVGAEPPALSSKKEDASAPKGKKK